MFISYLKIAARNLVKRKLYTLINVTGLAVGIGCFLLLSLYLRNEWTYDRFHEHGKQLYRMRTDYGEKDQPVVHTAMTMNALAPLIKDFSGVKMVSRVYPSASTVRNGDKITTEKQFIYTDPDFFRMFSFPLIAGDPATALNGPDMVVLSASTARRYFGTTDIVGKLLKIDDKSYQVTGVAKDPPANTHLKFDFVASYASLGEKDNWNRPNYLTYVMLADNIPADKLHQQLQGYIKDRFGKVLAAGATLDLVPEALGDLHLHSLAQDGSEQYGDIRYNRILTVVAILLLLVACINFVNLATARSAERSREIGVRKALGAVRGQVFWQFIAESFLITGYALIVGVLIAMILLPSFNNIVGVKLVLDFTTGYWLYALLALIFITTAFVAGTYPAFFLARFRPVQTLKGHTPLGGRRIRKTLVVFQFAASVFFIICTLVVQRQLHYIQHKQLGLDRSGVLVLSGGRFGQQQLAAFKERVLQQAGVQSVSASYDSPVAVGGGYSIGQVEGKRPEFGMNLTAIPVEKDYLRTMGITLLAGSDLTNADIQDVLKAEKDQVYHFFLNESAVKALGWTSETALGKRLVMNGRAGTVKGVMKDFHFASMKLKIEPIIVFPEYNWFGQILVKVSGNNQQVIAAIGKLWNEYQQGIPFEYHFMDEDFNNLYTQEYKTGYIMAGFSTIIILVACLGLFGLVAFTAEQRTREIGIRKVLGASAGSVVLLLSRDFMKLVMIALLIASPLAWYAMQHWLNSFAYNAGMSAGAFLLAGGAAIIIAMATASMQSVKAALRNPVDSLRSE
ncbi:ABC transporter permease [Chitinophaga sp. 212800010-3]|uniref:ABC transporter permease n=1 Tax=unclassified Chitinophaga TaxID=2619133 RepID=UPI002DF3F5CB|nr:ABC transport system permease protein [Chitinophaga sp. 212800010-3]